MWRKRLRQASPIYCRRCGNRVGASGTGFLCPSCGAGQATVQDGHVIARPSQLVERRAPPSRVRRLASRAKAGSARVRRVWSRIGVGSVRTRLGDALDVMLADVRAGYSVVIGLLIAMMVTGAIVALLAR